MCRFFCCCFLKKRLSRFQLFSNASHYLIIRVCQHVAKSYSFFFKVWAISDRDEQTKE
jgi:hypothetical protein